MASNATSSEGIFAALCALRSMSNAELQEVAERIARMWDAADPGTVPHLLIAAAAASSPREDMTVESVTVRIFGSIT